MCNSEMTVNDQKFIKITSSNGNFSLLQARFTDDDEEEEEEEEEEEYLSSNCQKRNLKTGSHYDVNFVVTGCAVGLHNDKLRWH